jgi:hypothetical protein
MERGYKPHLMSSVCSDVRPARLVERDAAPSAPISFSLQRERREGMGMRDRGIGREIEGGNKGGREGGREGKSEGGGRGDNKEREREDRLMCVWGGFVKPLSVTSRICVCAHEDFLK